MFFYNENDSLLKELVSWKGKKKSSIFRKETLERISSPEQLTDYLRVTNPGIWIVLAGIVILLVGFFVWMSVDTIETTVKVGVSTQNSQAIVAVTEGDTA